MGRRGGGAAGGANADAPAQHLSRFAHALIPPFKSKDELTKALKATADALSSAPQATDGAVSLGPLANALVDRALLAHKDKDIRLRSAFCLAHALRVAAPDAPYTPAQLSDAFAAFGGAVAELSRGAQGTPAFALCLQTLETIAAVRCSVLALDLDSPEAAVGLAGACFSAVSAPRTADEMRAAAGGGGGGGSAMPLPLPLPPTGDGDDDGGGDEEQENATALTVPGAKPKTTKPSSASNRAAAISNVDAVEAAALDVLSTMLDEADELPPLLVDAVVSPLLPPARDARPEAAAFARKLLKRCEVKLQPAVQRLLVAAIESGGVGMSSSASASSSTSTVSATERAADLIAEVAAACPQALLPVIPKLIDELQVEDEARRAGAVAIAVSLLSAPSSSSGGAAAAAAAANAAASASAAAAAADTTSIISKQQASLGVSHGTLLDALLRRARDRSAALRATVTRASPGLLAGAPDSALRSAVLAAAQGRLVDPDERVRAAAAGAICACARGGGGGGGGSGGSGNDGGGASTAAAAAAANANDASASRPSSSSSPLLLGLRSLGTSSLQPLLAVGDRLRDASPLVARAAAAGLLSLFRAHAAALHAGEEVSSTEELVLWIPGKLLAAAAASADLRNFCFDALFARPPSAVLSTFSSSSSYSASVGGGGGGGVINPPSLLPGRLSPRAVARQWATIYMTSSRAERAAICALLRSRGCAAGAAAEAAAARAALRAAGGRAAAEAPPAIAAAAAAAAAGGGNDSGDDDEEENGNDDDEEEQPKKKKKKASTAAATTSKRDEARAALRRLDSAISRLSSIFPSSSSSSGDGRARAAAALRALIAEAKDNGVARALAALAAPGTRSVDAAAAAAELVARAPAGHAKEAAKVLAARIAPSLIPPEVIPELFLAAAAPSSDPENAAHVPAPSAPDGRFAAAALSLLTDAAASDPSLFARAAPAVADAIAADDALLKSASLSVLASAGGAMRAAADADAETSLNNDAAEDVLGALADAAAEAAREGPPAACRTAVRALSVLLPTAEAARVLRGVATRHVRHLASSGGGGGGGGGGASKKTALSDPRKTRVALAALGALGAAAPSVFATHAAAVSDFVMSVMLPAPASAFGRGGALAATGAEKAPSSSSSSSSGRLPPPSVAAAAKAEALEDLAAALIPDPTSPLALADAREAAEAKKASSSSSSSSSSATLLLRPRMTPEAAAVADRLVPELTGLVDPEAAATDGSAVVQAAHAAIVAAAGGGGGGRGRGGGGDGDGGDEGELSPAARADAAALRLGSARALLLLLKSADSRVPPASYIALSLVLQDQESDVRSAFRHALVSAVVDGSFPGGGGGSSSFSSFSSSSPPSSFPVFTSAASAVGGGSRASKLAAPLALSAVDPSRSAQRTAFAAMQRFVAARRDAVALAMRARAAAAARGGGGGGGGENNNSNNANATDSLLHEAPEYAMTYLLQILAHHPDFPSCGPPTGGGPFPAPEELAPFVAMLQLAIEPMVAGAALAAAAAATAAASSSSRGSASSSSSSRASAGAALHALCKVLRAVRGCDDATAEPATASLALLADMGLAVAKLLAAKHGVPLPSASAPAAASGAAAGANPLGAADGGATTTAAALFGGGGGGNTTTTLGGGGGDRFPGGVPLPRSLYKAADPPRPKLVDGALLPPGWTPVLVPDWMPPVASGRGGGAGAGGAGSRQQQQQQHKRARAAGGAASAAAGAKRPRPSAVAPAGAAGAAAASSRPAAFPSKPAAAAATAAVPKKEKKTEPKAKKRAAAPPPPPPPSSEEKRDEFDLGGGDDADADGENVAPQPKPSLLAPSGKNKSGATTTRVSKKGATTATATTAAAAAGVAPKKKKAKASPSPKKAPAAAAAAAATRATRHKQQQQQQQQQKLDGWTSATATQTTAEETEEGGGGASAASTRATSKRAPAAATVQQQQQPKKKKDKQQTKLPFAPTRASRQGGGVAAAAAAAAPSPAAGATRRSLRTRN